MFFRRSFIWMIIISLRHLKRLILIFSLHLLLIYGAEKPGCPGHVLCLGFCITWFCFLIGLFAQISCILMTACCYYFYALNSFQIGTLSWDILLVTLFLMCVTPYHGDYFSVDALRRGDIDAWRRPQALFLSSGFCNCRQHPPSFSPPFTRSQVRETGSRAILFII